VQVLVLVPARLDRFIHQLVIEADVVVDATSQERLGQAALAVRGDEDDRVGRWALSVVGGDLFLVSRTVKSILSSSCRRSLGKSRGAFSISSIRNTRGCSDVIACQSAGGSSLG